MDSGLGDAEFLDELIPVEEWATGGQQDTHEQPQTNGANRPVQAGRAD
jgi:hypothetical protein